MGNLDNGMFLKIIACFSDSFCQFAREENLAQFGNSVNFQGFCLGIFEVYVCQIEFVKFVPD